MGKAVKSLVGAVFGGGSAPKASPAPVQQTQEEQRSAKASRSALFETEGGVAGSELDPDQVKQRRTLLGN